MAILTILHNLWHFGIFVIIWVTFSCFGVFYKEKSGNPGED
jgi:hypothetical protein